MPNNNVHSGHRERMRQRFLKEGLDGFELHNILELLLFFGIPRIDTNELAHALLNQFGSLSRVLDASTEELRRVKGMTENAAVLLKLFPSIARLYFDEKMVSGEPLDSPDKLGEFFVPKFLGRTVETIFLLSLDSVLRPLGCDKLDEGTAKASSLEVKQIYTLAARHNASRVVLAHNHPQGIAKPSNSDVIVTRGLQKGLRLLDIELVDHIIVADGDFYSVAKEYGNLG